MPATATNRTTQPTSEIMKLNFITDQGSTLDRTSCALRIEPPEPGRTCCADLTSLGRGGAFFWLLAGLAGRGGLVLDLVSIEKGAVTLLAGAAARAAAACAAAVAG